MDDVQFNNELMQLLADVGIAYEQSDIKKVNSNWSYALIGPMPTKGSPLLIGINWGGGNNSDEKFHAQMDFGHEDLSKHDLGKLKDVLPYCRDRLGADMTLRMVQTNYNFFRSPKESDLSAKDFALCEPIFERLIALVEPEIMVCLSSKLHDYFLKNRKLENIEIANNIKSVSHNRSIKVSAIKATLNGVKIVLLPHPGAHISSEAREAAWDFCLPKVCKSR